MLMAVLILIYIYAYLYLLIFNLYDNYPIGKLSAFKQCFKITLNDLIQQLFHKLILLQFSHFNFERLSLLENSLYDLTALVFL